MDKKITNLPSGWTYTDGTQMVIKKEYDKYTIEQVEIKTEDGKISKIEVIVDEINILASSISKNKNQNYGMYTNYSVDIDGNSTNNDWKIFYADKNGNVFLIADYYLPYDKLDNSIIEKNGMLPFDTYSIEWDEEVLNTLNYISIEC